MLINYYQGIVQYLKKWEKPVPQIPVKEIEPETITSHPKDLSKRE
jgi:hypothetical protein